MASGGKRAPPPGHGGSGIRENDPELRKMAEAMDPEAPAPTLEYGDGAHSVPVLAVNGEYDRPYSKAQRILREFETFENVMLPGLNHMTAIMVGGPMPQKYIDSIVSFIDTYDEP